MNTEVVYTREIFADDRYLSILFPTRLVHLNSLADRGSVGQTIKASFLRHDEMGV